MRIGELAQRLDLNPRTIRFYEATGVLPEPERTPSGYRDYEESDVDRLRFIKLAQSLGLSLDEISEVLAFRDRGEPPCAYVTEVIRNKAADIDHQIEQLQKLRRELRRLARRARELPEDASGRRVCHILEQEKGSSI
jgi:MerR family copper efflux transcriptional regulator